MVSDITFDDVMCIPLRQAGATPFTRPFLAFCVRRGWPARLVPSWLKLISMAQQRDKSSAFKTVKLFKDQTLGIGSYGKVCKAKCDDLLCAAKLIHETLFDPTAQQLIVPQREHRLPMRRFEQECEFLSTIRHPNIVQYLGVYQDPDTGLPALLMELMDDSLTHFLASSPQPIPYHIQVNICHDITLALSFLHSNDIVHRDLSSNNVLLIGNVRAKVTDFGMARLGDQNLRATQLTFTMCPGTDVYMPPEAVQEESVYTEKIDCFSFGVVTVQILTRQFPNPGNRRRKVQINHPGLPSGTFEMVISEVERRQNHIGKIDPNHTLLQVALDCLKDRDVERPSAQQLCERVAALKEGPQYSESVRVVESKSTAEQDRSDKKDRELRSLRQQHSQQVQIIRSQAIQLEEKDQTITQKDQALREKDETIAAEQQQPRRQHSEQVQDLQWIIQSQTTRLKEKDQTITQNDRALRDKDKTIAELRQQTIATQQLERDGVEEKEREVKQKVGEIDQLEREKNQEREILEKQLGCVNQQLKESERVNTELQRRVAELEQLRPATDTTSRSEEQSSIRASIKLTWREGKKAPSKISGSYGAAVDGSTLYVRKWNQEVYAYTISTSSWSQLPDSPSRNCPSVIINNFLTLIGGHCRGTITYQLFSLTGKGSGRRWTEEFPPMPTKRQKSIALCTETALVVAGGKNHNKDLSVVEVLNTETLQWSTAADLPTPLTFAPAAVCGDHVYILKDSNMYTCSVSALVQSCKPSLRKTDPGVWTTVAAPRVIHTTCVSIHGQLLAIGGKHSDEKITSAVHMYNPTIDSWEVISHMAMPRQRCIAAVLPNGQLMVVGGWTRGGETDSIEFAAVEQ